MIIHNLKVAVRNLMKYKLQVTISVLSIAIGIVTLALVHAFLTSVSLPSICSQPYYERTYSLSLVVADSTGRDISTQLNFTSDIIRALKRDGGLKTAERMTVPNGMIMNAGAMEFQLCDSTKRKFETGYCPIDPEYIPFIGLRSAITGKPIKKLQPGEAVISELMASLTFGEANPVGAVCFDVNSTRPMPLTIADVYEDVSLMEQFIGNDKMYYSLGEIEDVWTEQEHSPFWTRYVKIVLKEGCTESQLMAELNERLKPFNCSPKQEEEAEVTRVGMIINIQLFVHLAGSLILLAAIIGFLRMQIQLFWMRKREVSLRMVNGAKRGQLFPLLFTEVFIVVALSVAVAMMMGVWTEDFIYTRFAELTYRAEFSIRGFARYGLYIGGALLLICGLVIWLTLMRICNAGQGLAANMQGSRSHLFRNVMLGLQITICILFVCSTLILSDWGNSMMKQHHLPDDLTPYKESLLLNLEPASTGAEALMREIERLHSLKKMVAHRSSYTGVCDIMGDKEVEAAFHDQTYWPMYYATDTALVEFLQCKVNWFNKPMNEGEYLILNEGLYKKLRELGIADNDMLTMAIYDGRILPIAGTIPDLPYDDRQTSIMVHPGMASYCREFVLIPQEGKYRSLVHEVDSVIRRMEPAIMRKMTQNFHESHTEVMMVDTVRRTGWLLAAVSIIICAMGIYSAIALDTRSRKKEVAIRKVNGAKSGDIYRLFGRLYFILTGIALLIALTGFMAFLDKFHNNFDPQEQGVSTFPPMVLFAAGSLLVIIMIAAIVARNIRSIMQTDPAETLAKE